MSNNQHLASAIGPHSALREFLEVLVPKGLGPGEKVAVDYCGDRYELLIPDGCLAGDTFQAVAPSSNEIEITVPVGLGTDRKVAVDYSGFRYEVMVPQGCAPGSCFRALVPRLAMMEEAWDYKEDAIPDKDSGKEALAEKCLPPKKEHKMDDGVDQVQAEVDSVAFSTHSPDIEAMEQDGVEWEDIVWQNDASPVRGNPEA